ncbi:MAG: electron transport complex, RnfABCDGE type, subunit [Oscillospiraceae bacterium]|jgi:electron transport complex protein RnfD|nr:electron transport complex, RnfABCDGE type, subunit [Oscillospiraceae bacterium]
MTTQKIMLRVIIALMPAVVASGIIFGVRAILLILLCASSCVVFEYLSRKLMRRSNTIYDLSAVVTGILLAMNLPPTLPFWMAIIGSFVSIVIVKQLFGGLGQNFANPAIVGRIVLMLSFTTQMTTWVKPFWYKTADLTTSPTPLSSSIEKLPSYLDLFLGTTGGCLGETCALALLIGGLYLAFTGIISLSTPVSFLGTLALLSLIGGADPLYQILSGGAMIGAFFMATDYATTPVTNKGKIIFGIGCGTITFLIRQFGSYPEGVSFSILLMNILTPYIDMLTKTKPLGAKKEARKNG